MRWKAFVASKMASGRYGGGPASGTELSGASGDPKMAAGLSAGAAARDVVTNTAHP